MQSQKELMLRAEKLLCDIAGSQTEKSLCSVEPRACTIAAECARQSGDSTDTAVDSWRTGTMMQNTSYHTLQLELQSGVEQRCSHFNGSLRKGMRV